MKFAKAISPENAFLVMGAIFGLLFVFLTPPFQVPDEPQHFHRAYHLSELRFFDAVYLSATESGGRGGSWLGALLPKSLASLVTGTDLLTTRFRPYSKLIPSKLLSALKIPLNADEREYLPIAPYPGAGHIPQAIGIAIGRTLRQPPLVLFYLGRLGGLAAWLSVVFLAIKTTPVLKWTFFLLALMPMTLYLAASNSADSFVISVTFLTTATLLKWAYDDTKESVRGSDVAWLAVMAIGIASSKVIYLPVILLFLLIPRHKFKNRRKYYGSLVCILAIALAAYFSWDFLIAQTTAPGPTLQFSRYGIDPPPFSKISGRTQMELISSNPETLVSVLTNTASAGGVFMLYSFFGLLGWVDVLLPLWLPFLYAPALIAASLLTVSKHRVTVGARLLSASIFGATLLVSLLLIYINANPVGATMVTGYQGRYLIPVAPVLCLLFHGNFGKTTRANGFAIIMLLCVVTTGSVAAHNVYGRFYSGKGVAYHIDDISMSPHQDFVTVTGWAVDRQPADPAACLDITVDVFPAIVSESSSIGDRAYGLDLKNDGPYYPARYGIDRSDVAEATYETSYRYSGFEARVPVSELGDGNLRTLALRITTRNRKSYLVRVFADR